MDDKTEAGEVRLVNIYKSFREGQEQVLRGVSIDFPVGQLTYILGASGAGKSVILKHILGLLKPDSGEVWVSGKNISCLRGRELAEHRKVFGMLFQNAALFDDMTVFENVAFPLREHTRMTETEISNSVCRSLEILGMPGGFTKYPNELSGGMRKRVALARAIIREPSILLYDEPTTGLDPVTRETVDELIARLKKTLGLTSIVISHDIASALAMADRIAFLHKGKIVFWGSAAEFRESDNEAIRGFLNAERQSAEAILQFH